MDDDISYRAQCPGRASWKLPYFVAGLNAWIPFISVDRFAFSSFVPFRVRASPVRVSVVILRMEKLKEEGGHLQNFI